MSVSCHLFHLVANKETNSSLSYSYIKIAHVTKMWLKCFFFFFYLDYIIIHLPNMSLNGFLGNCPDMNYMFSHVFVN